MSDMSVFANLADDDEVEITLRADQAAVPVSPCVNGKIVNIPNNTPTIIPVSHAKVLETSGYTIVVHSVVQKPANAEPAPSAVAGDDETQPEPVLGEATVAPTGLGGSGADEGSAQSAQDDAALPSFDPAPVIAGKVTDVVPRLAHLSIADLRKVHDAEATGQNRITILNAIDGLIADAEPAEEPAAE